MTHNIAFQLQNAALQLRQLVSAEQRDDIINSLIIPSITHKLNIAAPIFQPKTSKKLNGEISSEIGSTRSGQPGANLFIYHLPKWFSDLDLYQLFIQHGRLVSAKIFKDKHTQGQWAAKTK